MERIRKILGVVDTREYEEVADGKWAPVPGSGTESLCARCGRGHYVHATVELDSGKTAVVGTGCMLKTSMAFEADTKQIKSMERAAKKVQQLKAELADLETKREKLADDIAQVDQLPLPAIVEVAEGKYGPAIQMGDVEYSTQFVTTDRDMQHRRQELVQAWRQNRLADRGWVTGRNTLYVYDRDIEDIEDQLEKTERKLTMLAEAMT